MATLSTLSTTNVVPAKPVKYTLPSVQDVWQHYFKNDHNAVINDGNRALFEIHAPDYLHVLGLSYIAAGKIDDAKIILKAALNLYPKAPSWFSNCSIASMNANQNEMALEFAIDGLTRFDDPVLHFVKGSALMKLGRLEEAQEPLFRAIQLKPDMNEAFLNLGNVARRLGKLPEALSLYTRLVNADSNNRLAIINRAKCLTELNKWDEATMSLLRLMAVSESPDVNLLMAQLRLIDGDLKTGFELYRSRYNLPSGTIAIQKPILNSLNDAKDKHVLVVSEGDDRETILCLRYLDQLEKICGITILVPYKFNDLISNLNSNIKIINQRETIPSHDFEIPMMDLPYLFGTTLDSLPVSAFNALPNTKTKRVGLIWNNQIKTNEDSQAIINRGSFEFSYMKELLQFPNVDFGNLQTGESASKIDNFRFAFSLGDYENRNSTTYADFVALLTTVDLIITVDSAVGHLAASLGKPVWMMTQFDQHWLWMRDKTNSPWYPSLRLFQQKTHADWVSVIAEIEQELKTWAVS